MAMAGKTIFPAVVIMGITVLARVVITVGGAVAVVLLLRKLLKKTPRKETSPEVEIDLALSLKNHRQKKNMTQEQVAEALGVSRQAVSKWENGTAEPSTSNLLALAKLYGVELGELVGEK